ncbi:hypothetical protein RHSIM_Rhsim03G0149600 [Rhododendron simsii]|uniref:Uncharacterized protein n=1 Tax=Rhododendron simsii TaxID=118357 RepID=A0A834LTG8_RHOSS|nr:hypothetical protein RHSIM_Rhsim03G0149600 [Rhododendron simsii]
MAAPWHTGNSEEAIEESDGITSCFWDFSPPSPQYLIGAWLTKPPQAPTVFHPGTNISLKNWEDTLSFTNTERSIQLRYSGNSEEAIEEAEEMTSCLWGSDHPSAQYLIGSWLTTPPQSPFMWSFDPPSPQYLVGSWLTTPPQSPCLCGYDPPSPQYPIGSTTSPQSPYLWVFQSPVTRISHWVLVHNFSQVALLVGFRSLVAPISHRQLPLSHPICGFSIPRHPDIPLDYGQQLLLSHPACGNALSFANRERSMQLQQQLLEEWSGVFNCARRIPQQQELQQLQYWIQALDFVEKGTTAMINWGEQGSRGPRGKWVAKTRVRLKQLKKRKKVKRPCIGGTFDTAEEVASRDGEKFRMKGEKARLNFPKLFLKIADPHLSDGDSELTQQLLQEWRNHAFDFEAIGIFELLQHWSYALNFTVKGLLMTLNGLRLIMNSQRHGGEWVVKIRLRRSRHGNGDLDVIRLKGEKTQLNFLKLFVSTCEKGKGIIKNPGIKIEIPLEDILQCKEMRCCLNL